MATIISQISFFDYSEIESLGDLERLQLAFEGIDDEELMRKLEKKRYKGRNDYPIRVMWNLLIAMKVFGHKSIESLRRELSRNSQLRKICGLQDSENKKHLVPPARVFTKFLKLLKKEQVEIDNIFNNEVFELYEILPEFGKDLAGDGKYVDSYAKGSGKEGNKKAGERAENDAKFSVKEYKYIGNDGKTHTKKETHYGFKGHIICDTPTGLPIAYKTTAANYDEKKAMIELLENFEDEQKNRAYTITLDRGYDSMKMIQSIKRNGIIPVVDICNKWKNGEETEQYKNTNIVYNYKGDVFYIDENSGKQIKMNYEGHDKQKKCLRYSYKGKIYKIYISYDERIFLPIARDSKKFKKIYKGRTSVERLNGRLDRDFMFEDHCIRGLEKMNLMLSLSFIIMNGIALGKLHRGITNNLAAITKIGTKQAA